MTGNVFKNGYLYLNVFLCLFSLLLSAPLSANQAAAVLDTDTPATVLGPYMDFQVDKTGSMQFEDILSSDQWRPVNGKNIIGGFTDDVYWVKFSVHNQATSDQNWVLEIDYPIIDFIEFYQPDLAQAGHFKKTLAGDKYPFNQRPIDNHNVVFPILSPANSIQTFYLRFQTESSMYIALNMLPRSTLAESMDDKLIIFGWIYGIVFLATIYCLINAVFLRERMYLFIAIGIFGSMGYSMSLNGFAFQYIWPNSLWVQSVAIPVFLNLCFGFSLFYSREFLDIQKISPVFDKAIIGLSSFCLLMAGLSLLLSYGFVIRISTVFAIVMSIAAFIAGAISFYKGNKSARYYLIGWMALFIGAVTFALKSLGVIPSNLFTVWGQEIGFACISVFLTLAQSDHFFQAKKKHEAEQAFNLNAIKNAEKKYRSLFENALEGIFQVDLSGRLVNANKAFAEIVGSNDIDMLLAHPHPPFSLSCLSKTEQTKLKNLLDKDNSITGFETHFKLPSNETRWISISIQKIQNRHGMAMHYEGTMADITETKKRQHAEKQQRMAEASTEAKSLFLANMSHEIRTPMNAIIGFTDLALGRNQDLQLTGYLQKIRMASTNLLGIINDILDFSKIEAGKLEIEHAPFSMKEVLKNLNDIVSVPVETKGLKLDIHVDDDIPDTLVGDALRIGQVLLNLTNNAIKFTSEGKVSVHIELLSLSKQDMSIKLRGRITDTGIGIPEDKLKNLFSSFTQADESTTRRFGGTGLGLSISKQLVEMMGGDVSVESEPGIGSTFSFTLSLGLQDRRQRTNPHFIYHQLPLHILVVDDQQESRELIEKVLLTQGHQVTCVTNAHETIQELKAKQRQNKPYDMLIADWLMPEIDGIGCCKMVKDDPEIINPRMILITGYDQNEAKQKVAEAGLDAYMIKPLRIPELTKVIEQIFKDRRTPDSTPSNTDSHFDFENLNVLLVEDVVMNQELAIEILSKKKLKITVANNGQEGVDKVANEKFDIVLMDMQMPVMDGCQATEAIREFNQQLPIVAMTANAMTGDKNRCLAAGMNDYITKPINPDELFRAIRKWVTKARNPQHVTTEIIIQQDDHDTPTEDSKSPNKNAINDASLKFIASLEADMQKSSNDAKTEPQQRKENTSSLPKANKLKKTKLEAIDINEGLARCQQNTRLYLKFFTDFKRDYTDSGMRLHSLFNEQNLQGIHELAHKIKGVSSNLAAKALAQVSETIENAPQLDQMLIEKINLFEEELARCLVTMDAILEKSGAETEPQQPATSKTFDNEECRAHLSHLKALLEKQELDASEYAMTCLTGWPDTDQRTLIQGIINALDIYDFEKALRIWSQLNDQLS